MNKNTRGHVANPEPKRRRALKLSRDTVRVLSATELARAVGGSGGCDTTSYTSEHVNGTGVKTTG